MIPALDFRNTPLWLKNLSGLDQLPVFHLLNNSLYYPASGRDGDPVRYLGGFIHSFIYVDYGLAHDEVWASLHNEQHGFKGYSLIGCRDVFEEELTPKGWNPISPLERDGFPDQWRSIIKLPFAIWSVWERKPLYNMDHGPERFSQLYICGDGAATFQALYHENSCAPEVVTIIQSGNGFGFNWTDFRKSENILGQNVLQNPYGRPKYLLFGGWNKDYLPCCWPQYSKLVHYWNVDHGELGLWRLP